VPLGPQVCDWEAHPREPFWERIHDGSRGASRLPSAFYGRAW